MTITKWDARFLGLVKHVAQWSKDPSSKVGAALVDPANRVVSLGYNGPPRYVKDEFDSREQKLRRSLHAEQNAIMFSQRDLSGCTLYVTHPPCARCTAEIIQSGITKVVYFEPTPSFKARWADDLDESRAMFTEAEVFVEEVKDV